MDQAGHGGDVRELIATKRAGRTLAPEDVHALIARYVRDDVPDEQMAALLMAGLIRGFDASEAVALTEALVASGTTIDLSGLTGPTVDKHSTGGVGDTTTLVVAPLLAACGVQVVKLSGRALGHTGGTLDKLESIPGLRVDLSAEEVLRQVDRIGVAVAAATDELVPADKRLYALRDLTGTVDAPALIASSVMSKKLAGGAANILLDVKTGEGAFARTAAAASALAALCVHIGESAGRRTGALVSDMSQPLGHAVGNALEVRAAIEVLGGRDRSSRLARLCAELAASGLVLTGHGPEAATAAVERALASGAALERFGQLVAAQGGDRAVSEDPDRVLPAAPVVLDWKILPGPAREDLPGVVQRLACRELGLLAHGLGAGRGGRAAAIDHAVGLEVLISVGDRVEEGTAGARIHARSEEDARRAGERLADLVEVGAAPVAAPPLVHERLGPVGQR